ncbi:MAG TPA: SDR family NAD(P)-dependent oxidoreductase [Acidimicrobiia bacterium]|nr:SDR family NAD(P)-dependent oxidoreductase [Acidimicrobiia bacterium]
MRDFTDKVAVVTGAASGIGFAMAQRFAQQGMHVVLGDVEADALAAAGDTLAAAGAQVLTHVTDVTDAAQVQALADATIERFGAVHIVCNNAGVGGGGLSWETPLETWEWVIGVNLWGVIHGVRTFVPLLIAQPEAHVVNTASVAGLTAAPFMGPYNASKHAVVAISETLHHELEMTHPHVKVSVVCPGWVRTRIFESERNRPAHLALPPDPDREALGDVLRAMIETGLGPDEVADQVLAAVRDERFWVLTHDDEADFWVDAVNRRLESVRTRTNPRSALPS